MAHTTTTITTDAAFEVLAHPTRRAVLRHLTASDGTAAPNQLVASVLADLEHEPAATSEGVRLELHHCHLPKLRAFGLVEYDQPGGPVRYQADQRVEDLLLRCSSG